VRPFAVLRENAKGHDVDVEHQRTPVPEPHPSEAGPGLALGDLAVDASPGRCPFAMSAPRTVTTTSASRSTTRSGKSVHNHLTLFGTMLRAAAAFKVPWLLSVRKFNKPTDVYATAKEQVRPTFAWVAPPGLEPGRTSVPEILKPSQASRTGANGRSFATF
jgi:hypothetical protein